jgi:hypothetical protein
MPGLARCTHGENRAGTSTHHEMLGEDVAPIEVEDHASCFDDAQKHARFPVSACYAIPNAICNSNASDLCHYILGTIRAHTKQFRGLTRNARPRNVKHGLGDFRAPRADRVQRRGRAPLRRSLEPEGNAAHLLGFAFEFFRRALSSYRLNLVVASCVVSICRQ